MGEFRAIVCDQDGFVVDADEQLAHLREHGPDDEACGDCAGEVSVRTRTALPVGDRLPGSYQSLDLLIEHDLLSDEVAEAIGRIRQAREIAAALNGRRSVVTTVLLPAADCFAAAFAIAATIKWACDRPKRRHRDSAR